MALFARAIALGCLLAMIGMVSADVYLHNMRGIVILRSHEMKLNYWCILGSNDRLNEATNDRNNGNRLFDSQNNARGGYNVGDDFAKVSMRLQNNPMLYPLNDLGRR